MPLPPLHYEPVSAVAPWRRFLSWKVALIAVVVLVALFVPTQPCRQVESSMDPVTGSTRVQTTWPFGIRSTPRVEVSPLESQLVLRGISWNPSWQLLNDNTQDLLGNPIAYGCGDAPEIYSLRPLLPQFAAVSTDHELREFVRVMQSGTDAEQRAAVEAAAEKVLGP